MRIFGILLMVGAAFAWWSAFQYDVWKPRPTELNTWVRIANWQLKFSFADTLAILGALFFCTGSITNKIERATQRPPAAD